MSGYVITPEANADLLRMWLYIARDSEDIADRVQTEFYAKFDSLSRHPGQGHRRTDYTKANVLFFPVYSYLIAYRPRTDPLEILAVVHGAREVKKVLNR
ncbi:MAG: type II toxin-antitoxin system RelE/ParE family toxin [Bryobacteraceae bacterium]